MKHRVLLFVLALLGTTMLNAQFGDKRPNHDIPLSLIRVEIDSSFPATHWIRTYDVYAPVLPYPELPARQRDFCYIPLTFVPSTDSKPPKGFTSAMYTFEGLFRGDAETYKPFQISLDQIQTKQPFTILLDYVNGDFSSAAMSLRPKISNHPMGTR